MNQPKPPQPEPCISTTPDAQRPHRPDNHCPDKRCGVLGQCIRAQAHEGGELPPLPAPRLRFEVAINHLGERMDYTAADMHAYARTALAAQHGITSESGNSAASKASAITPQSDPAPAPAEAAGEIVEMDDGSLVPVWTDGTPATGTKLYTQPKVTATGKLKAAYGDKWEGAEEWMPLAWELEALRKWLMSLRGMTHLAEAKPPVQGTGGPNV